LNDATELDGAVLGGCLNTTGGGTNPQGSQYTCATGTDFNTITGGMNNLANGLPNSVGGGTHNTADGTNGAAVIGGYGNTSNGDASVQISGLNRLVGGHNGAQVGSTGFNP
jgi:hypothetical protein